MSPRPQQTTPTIRFLRRVSGWPVLVALAGVAFVLGYWGFHSRLGDERSIGDLTYLTLQLFVVESGTAAGPDVPWTLEVARFLAPATTALALTRALVRVFREEIEQFRLRRRRDHTVVVGLGWIGLALVETLVDAHKPVVAVTLGLDDEAVASVRRSRVPVVIGDARDPEVLREARVPEAAHLIVIAGADGTNAEVALAAGSLVAGRDTPLVCLTHIRDPDLCQVLRAEELARKRPGGFDLDFFNVAERAARLMLDEHGRFIPAAEVARIGVVGGNDVAEAVVVEAARARRIRAGRELEVVVAGPESVTDRWTARHHALRRAVRFRHVAGPPGPVDDPAVAALAECGVVFVCLDDDAAAIAAALDVAGRIGQVPVVIALGEWIGLAEVLSSGPAASRRIHPFMVFSRILEADVLLAGTQEVLARSIHDAYVAQRRRAGTFDAADPALTDWESLADDVKASNRAQAASLGEKLAEIGCGLAPLVDWDAPPETLTEAEVDVLAPLEHRRYVDERIRAGYRYGPVRDASARTNPNLVPWDELRPEARDQARDAVRAIPSLLAEAGYRLVRPPR